MTQRRDNTSDERASALKELIRQGNVGWDNWHPPMITPVDEVFVLMDMLGIDASWFFTVDTDAKRKLPKPRRVTNDRLFEEWRTNV